MINRLLAGYNFPKVYDDMWTEVTKRVQGRSDLSAQYAEMSAISDIDEIATLIKDRVWCGKEHMEILKELHARKYLYKMLLERGLVTHKKPFVLELTGTPRAGKTTAINGVADFFQKAGYKVKIIEELVSTPYFKKVLKKARDNMATGKFNILLIEETFKQLKEACEDNTIDIVIIDRGVNDRQIWNYLRCQTGDISKEEYEAVTQKYIDLSNQYSDVLVALKIDAVSAVIRDYLSSIAIETRRFNNKTNIAQYNDAMDAVADVHVRSVKSFISIPDAKRYNPVGIMIIAAHSLLGFMISQAIMDGLYSQI